MCRSIGAAGWCDPAYGCSPVCIMVPAAAAAAAAAAVWWWPSTAAQGEEANPPGWSSSKARPTLVCINYYSHWHPVAAPSHNSPHHRARGLNTDACVDERGHSAIDRRVLNERKSWRGRSAPLGHARGPRSRERGGRPQRRGGPPATLDTPTRGVLTCTPPGRAHSTAADVGTRTDRRRCSAGPPVAETPPRNDRRSDFYHRFCCSLSNTYLTLFKQ